MATVELAGVSKAFGAVSVLKDISLKIESGDFVTLVGPSGCGKSTLLRMIAGLEEISGGKVSIGGRVVNDLPSKDRDISMVFQSYALYPHMTVEDNMAFSLKIRKISPEVVKERVRQAAAILELSDLLDRYPRQLSGGQRQRVAMGRAIVRDPLVFLFDEPLSNLDATLRVQMRAEIKELHHRLGNTMIYVTHDQVEALSMADVVVVMRAGKIEQAGPPLTLYDQPANTFVAQFIGSPAMNIIQGEVSLTGSVPVVVITPEVAIEVPRVSNLPHGFKVSLGIRPNAFHVGEKGVPVQVVVTEALGSETQLLVRIANAQGKPITIQVNERLDFSPGQIANFEIDIDRIHLFDTDTGLRIH
jgi:multiple sugar transport system ATP-binding protein